MIDIHITILDSRKSQIVYIISITAPSFSNLAQPFCTLSP